MWKRYRRILELLQGAVLTGLPFVRVGGESAFRIDVVNMKLHFFGAVLWVSDAYIFLSAVLFFSMLLIALTNILGRVWCGWACPQTVLLDLSRDLARSVSGGLSDTIQKALLIPLSALVSFSVLGYFLHPIEIAGSLFRSPVVTGFFLVQWAVIYAMTALLGRTFCSTICPYSMLQGGLFDSGTLVVAFDGERTSDCRHCDRCVRDCPVAIDIRRGLQRECVACAACIDACAAMMSRAGKTPLIGYRGKIFRPKAFILAGVTVCFALAATLMLALRPDVDFVLTRNPEQPARGVNSYTYAIRNNSGKTFRGVLSVSGPFVLIGTPEVVLAPFGHSHGKVMVKPAAAVSTDRIIIVLRIDGLTLERQVGYL